MDLLDLPPGLKGVPVAETALSGVRGDEGFYHYRQYPAPELARRRPFEDAWLLLWDGELPDDPTRARFAERLARFRRLPDAVAAAVCATAGVGGPVDAMRTSVSLLAAARGSRPVLDLAAEEIRAEALAIAASMPALVAALHEARGGAVAAPDPDLGHAAAYLHSVIGRRPRPAAARALERYLVLTIDHGFNASTFTARVIASTGADVGGAVVGALGALSGPLHGGAPSRCLDAIDAIGTPERAEAWVRSELDAGRRLMGFGHAVYRVEDPRAALLRETALDLGGSRVAVALALERAALAELATRHPDRPLPANVEFWAALVLDACGLPPELFTPTFAVSRVVGWCAHVMEQVATGTLIRPDARYTGPPPDATLPPWRSDPSGSTPASRP